MFVCVQVCEYLCICVCVSVVVSGTAACDTFNRLVRVDNVVHRNARRLADNDMMWAQATQFAVAKKLLQQSVDEAKAAGEKIKNFKFDYAYSSDLQRAQKTLKTALEVAKHPAITPVYDKALNERMYGDLQGLDKTETAKKYGDDQVKIWRRSYDIAPPNGESLKDTAARVLPYFEKETFDDIVVKFK